jgi:hypothetical protein
MMLGVPDPKFAPPEDEFVPPVVEPTLLLDPSVPVVCGTPAFPTPVPRFGVTVVFPGPGPPGIPAPVVGPG